MELTLTSGISLILLTEAIVKLLKAMKVSTKLIPLMNVLSGITIVLTAELLGLSAIGVGQAIFTGLIVGLSTAGFYDIRSKVGLNI